MEKSPSGTLNGQDWRAIGKSFIIGLAGIVAVYAAAQIEAIDWATVGKYGFIIAPLSSVLVNFLRIWAKGR